MLDLNKLKDILQKKETKKEYPKHVIINMFPLRFTEETKKDDYLKYLDIITGLIELQAEKNIPIFTINMGSAEDIPDQTILSEFFDMLVRKAEAGKICVTAFGRWYALTGELTDSIKRLNNGTREYDNFFLNICINYDARQEIADSSRVIIRKILADKADIDSITPELLKENMASSYFVPAELVIEPLNKYSGTFLFDSAGSKITFLGKNPAEITKADISKAIENYGSK